MLRLVHPRPPGQGTRPPKGRRAPSLFLTAEEVQHFRAALGNVARAYGGFPVLAEVTGIPVQTLRQAHARGGRCASAIVALRVAQAGGMAMEAVIGPALNEAGRCKACGSRVGDHAGRKAS